MAQIDFYVLQASGEASREQFACRLAEKAYRLAHAVHILVEDPERARRMDDLLWTFRDGSFIPHEIIGTANEAPVSPVTIGSEDKAPEKCDLLINLAGTVPAIASSFPRVAEVVTSDEDSKQKSRERFVTYRASGHTLETHKL